MTFKITFLEKRNINNLTMSNENFASTTRPKGLTGRPQGWDMFVKGVLPIEFAVNS